MVATCIKARLLFLIGVPRLAAVRPDLPVRMLLTRKSGIATVAAAGSDS